MNLPLDFYRDAIAGGGISDRNISRADQRNPQNALVVAKKRHTATQVRWDRAFVLKFSDRTVHAMPEKDVTILAQAKICTIR